MTEVINGARGQLFSSRRPPPKRPKTAMARSYASGLRSTKSASASCAISGAGRSPDKFCAT